MSVTASRGAGTRRTSTFVLSRAAGRVALAWIAIVLAALSCDAASALAGTGPAGRVAPPAASSGPDFTNVTDILGGQRLLLPIDNLVVSGSFLITDAEECRIASSCLHSAYFYLQTTAPNTFALNRVALPPFPIVAPWSAGAVSTTTDLGRIFNLPNAVLVRLQSNPGVSPPFDIGPTVFVADVANSQAVYAHDAFPGPYSALSSGAAPVNATVLADFNGDGFDDIATSVGAGTMRIITAQDVNQPSLGLHYGPPLNTPAPFLAMAASDFNADGKMDIAAAYFDASASTGQLAIYTVDPQTLAITLVTSVAVPGMGPGVPGIGPNGTALTAGKYLNVAGSQLVLAVNGPNHSGVQLMSYSFDSQLAITQRSTFSLGVSATIVVARSGRLDALGGVTEQVVVGYGSVPGAGDDNLDGFQIFRFDDQLNFVLQSTTQLFSILNLTDVAIGNFTQGAAPTLEVAVLAVPRSQFPLNILTFGIGSIDVALYQLNPETLAPSEASFYTIPQSSYPSPLGSVFRFAAGDTLGQSLRLGSPMKLTIDSHIQPTIILGMPPMHVDFVPPAGSDVPQVLNVSAIPDGFSSNYQTVVTNADQSASTSTTSYSFGTMKSEGGGDANSLSVNGVSLFSFSGTTQTASGHAYTSFVQQQYDTYAGQQFDASTSTGFSDHVWFTSTRFNLWIYPVLGEAACPASQPQCDESEKLPLALIFSGPDQVTPLEGDGATQEWYQPVHEPGNVFSYPASLSQLSATIDGFSLLGSSPVWFTDTSVQTQFASWADQNSANVTSGSVAVHSRDKSASVGASIVGIGGGESVNYYTSDAFGTVNATVTTVGESSGLGVVKPGTFLAPGVYQYPVQTFIFGQGNPAGTTQTIQTNTTVQAAGALQSAFIADASGGLGTTVGPWWQHTYAKPDVALNHPLRWTVVSTTKPTGANCLRISPGPPGSDCATFNEPDLTDLPMSEFHWIRGFFVTPASANGTGPQTTVATAGEQLLLQVRVYNYSLAEMAEGTTVQVRFYGQPVDPNGDFSGPSFLIGEQTLDRIPPFNSGPNPNWTMASTTFDTTPYPDTSLMFWVVVWTEVEGALGSEMAGHGLTHIPGTLTSMAQVPIEPYSNNVGFYNQRIVILPPAGSASAPGRGLASRAVASQAQGALSINDVAASATRLGLGAKTVIAATLQAGATDERAVLVRFFDGDPATGGRMFDAELVPRIAAGQTVPVRVPFRPRTCGSRQIFVAARDQLVPSEMLTMSCRQEDRRHGADAAPTP